MMAPKGSSMLCDIRAAHSYRLGRPWTSSRPLISFVFSGVLSLHDLSFFFEILSGLSPMARLYWPSFTLLCFVKLYLRHEVIQKRKTQERTMQHLLCRPLYHDHISFRLTTGMLARLLRPIGSSIKSALSRQLQALLHGQRASLLRSLGRTPIMTRVVDLSIPDVTFL